jgi:hypothetical protein
MPTFADLQIIASAFRRSFETVDLSKSPGALPHFPEGCCHWASYMIGHYLKYEQKCDPSEVIGERSAADGVENHSWLNINGLVIDITSDEFDDSDEKVIVSKNSAWHKKWRVVATYPIKPISSFDDVRLSGQLAPSEIYELIAEGVRSQTKL